MDYVRKAHERGQANFGWLKSNHSFSFGHYYDAKHMGLSVLRVINDDEVAAGAGFDTHGHRDMEIISYVLEGSIKHKDSMGNEFEVPAGEVQRMSAGTGVTHSEYNGSNTERLRFLQIWIQPNKLGIKPSYEQARIEQTGKLTPLVTPDGREGSLKLHQDASMHRMALAAGEDLILSNKGRAAYLHVIEGSLLAEDLKLNAGDAAGITQTKSFTVKAGDAGVEALWFDLPSV
jgi:quercetin 2,3-dioxygenase